LTIRVTDETGAPVASALVVLAHTSRAALQKETDYAGQCEFVDVEAGVYQLRIEKEGFFASITDDFSVYDSFSVEVALNHQQEFAETVDVIDSTKRIDPAQTALTQKLDYKDILNLPYPTTRDIRFALPFIPGVLADSTAQIHVNGSETYQVFDQLDGFNITDPVSGRFELRVSADALRSVEILSSRYSAEHGKGSGGVLSLNTGMGDDRLRFSATNFIPTVQDRRGLSLNDWTPRATLSGPIKRDKAWFFQAADAEYKLNVVSELPEGEDRSSSWRWSSLTKGQINLSPTNILNAAILINRQHAGNAGLSRFDPVETTRDESGAAYLVTAKDQAYLANRMLVEVGVALSRFREDEAPQGSQPYTVHPEGTSGNFFETANSLSRRVQIIGDITFPSFVYHGRHELRSGVDIDRITYDQFFDRRDIFILREDETLTRRVSFLNSPRFEKNNLELSGFVQDRWSVSDCLLLETGVRLDWDQIVRGIAVSPRLSATYLLGGDHQTKISAGIGLFHDATSLELITRPLSGRRFDSFFDADGETQIGPPIETSFEVIEQSLKMPRFINWSIGVERKLPGDVYLQVNVLQKRGFDGFAYESGADNVVSPGQNSFVLRQNRRDRYDSFEITARKSVKAGYSLFASYVRSSARSNAVLDFTLNNLIIAQQAGGPLGWDAPNRLLSWGWLPLIKGFDFAYSIDWRDG
jgi:hypothetical protein